MDSGKLPKFLTTVTPFTKLLALSMYIVFPIVGFYFGKWYQQQTAYVYKSVETITIKPSAIPRPTPKKMDCDTNLICENDSVYYLDVNGQKITIAEEIEDENNPVNNVGYRFARFSPNKKFITIGGVQWESIVFEVYDISTGKKHTVSATGYEYGDWLPDSRLIVFGNCGMGVDCGIFVSKNNLEPWKMTQVYDPPISWTE